MTGETCIHLRKSIYLNVLWATLKSWCKLFVCLKTRIYITLSVTKYSFDNAPVGDTETFHDLDIDHISNTHISSKSFSWLDSSMNELILYEKIDFPKDASGLNVSLSYR